MTPGYTRDDGIVRTQIKDNLTRIERKGGQAEWFKTTGMTNATKDPGEDSEYLRRHAAQNLAAAAEVERRSIPTS